MNVKKRGEEVTVHLDKGIKSLLVWMTEREREKRFD